jgi:hypothetical protein
MIGERHMVRFSLMALLILMSTLGTTFAQAATHSPGRGSVGRSEQGVSGRGRLTQGWHEAAPKKSSFLDRHLPKLVLGTVGGAAAGAILNGVLNIGNHATLRPALILGIVAGNCLAYIMSSMIEP